MHSSFTKLYQQFEIPLTDFSIYYQLSWETAEKEKSQ